MDKVNSVQELIERTAHMPLERMRFFINEDRDEPRCFGIFHDDVADCWVVYKNKANGSRAVRYSGPDEAYAANELWMKIQSEIELRRPKAQMSEAEKRRAKRNRLICIGVILALVAGYIIYEIRKPRQGYYVVDNAVYYCQDTDWYWYDDGSWVYYDAPGGDWYGDGYYGSTYPFDDYSDRFENSRYYEEPSSSDNDSDIFDSWDSGDTDWDSDW